MLSWLLPLSGHLVPALQTPVPPQSHRQRKHSFNTYAAVSLSLSTELATSSPQLALSEPPLFLPALPRPRLLAPALLEIHALSRLRCGGLSSRPVTTCSSGCSTCKQHKLHMWTVQPGCCRYQFLRASSLASISTMPRATSDFQ